MTTMHGGKNLIIMYLQAFIAASFFSVSSGPALADSSTSQLALSGNLYFEDSGKGNMWTKTRSKKLRSASDVHHYLSNLNKGEFSDWRLPTKQELHDLHMVFDMKDHGEVKIQVEGKYWLVNDDGQLAVGAWEIGAGCGPERSFYAGEKGYVRAVRP